jgi:hypothetical protein
VKRRREPEPGLTEWLKVYRAEERFAPARCGETFDLRSCEFLAGHEGMHRVERHPGRVVRWGSDADLSVEVARVVLATGGAA